MKKTTQAFFLAFIACFLAWGIGSTGEMNSLSASGGYGGGGIQQDKGAIDKDKYQLGKSIYAGEFKLPNEVVEAKKFPQYERLNQIQNKLPRPEQRRTNLLSLAGRLTDEQLDALQHFVGIRFNVRIDK